MPEAPPPTLTERNKKSLEFIEDVTSNPDEVQQKVLSDILTRHKMLTSNIFNVMGFTEIQALTYAAGCVIKVATLVVRNIVSGE
ncbi:hypothetical protein Tco_0658352 [Tanacetum coccineum]